MKSIAVVGDIHGNAPAMEAAFAYVDARGVKDIYCLGDMFGKGPSSVEVYERVFERCSGITVGNWDMCLWEEPDRPFISYHRELLGPERCARVAALPAKLDVMMGDKRVKLYHGRPELEHVVYSDNPREHRMLALNAFDDDKSDVTGFADIHAPFVQMLDGRILFNCGSVGNACDGHTTASLAFLHYDEVSGTISVEIARVPYDRERAMNDAINAEGMPRLKEYLEELRTARYARKK